MDAVGSKLNLPGGIILVLAWSGESELRSQNYVL